MAIIERGKNTYLIRVYLGRHPLTKKRIEINETFYGTLEEAKKREQILKNNTRKGSLSMSPSMTVNQLIDVYLELYRHRMTKASLHILQRRFELYARPYIGSYKLRKVRMSDIQALFNFLLDPKKDKGDNNGEEHS